MESIRYLLGAIIRIALALFLVAFVLWLVSFLYPDLKVSNVVSTDFWKRDWLPAPQNYASFTPKSGGVYGTEYKPNPAFDGYKNAMPVRGQPGIEYVVYTESGTKVVKPDGSVVNESQTQSGTTYANRSLYVRNLSVFEGGGITYGQNIIGETRDTMFKNGAFPIFVVDQNGRLVATMQAVAMNTWAVPGWTRFHATVTSRLPGNTYCTLLFRSANQPTQVTLPVKCY